MTYINPITGSILQTGQVQRQQAANKDREARRQALLKDELSQQDEALDEQVESTEMVDPDDHRENSQDQPSPKGKKAADADENHLDLRA